MTGVAETIIAVCVATSIFTGTQYATANYQQENQAELIASTEITSESIDTYTTGNEELDALCQQILNYIITADMVDYEKLYTAYAWVYNNFTYVHQPNFDTWQDGAIDAIEKYSCDCYGFYATLRALYEYMGFECAETTSTPKDHYWVRVHYGDAWYHCDATNTWGGERFMLDNDELLAYYYDKPNYGGLWYEWIPD